ncbi:MAG: PhzF family phenazine biosynthesis protein [Candidatus Competibacteraceae bacterium]|nr:PhzF family phenazine biosynthesis protein [Candidatus Competibacteraceae bacterium]
MRYHFRTADVFTERLFGGNPLAVFPDARGLTDKDMQRVAREFNLSETVFVFPAVNTGNTRQLRIYTPTAEIPFAGHPTIGCAYVLAAIGEIPLIGDITPIVFEEQIGLIKVWIRARDGQPVFAQLAVAKLPEFGPEPPPLNDLARLLSLDPADLLSDCWTPQAVSCGVPFLCIPVRNRDVLRRVQLRLDALPKVLGTYWTQSVYVFTADPELPGSDWRVRMFAPSLGVAEDAATGAAAAAFAGYLADRSEAGMGTLRWVIEQGFEMDRPSLLEAEADKSQGSTTAIRVGGSAVEVSEGWMEIPVTEA